MTRFQGDQGFWHFVSMIIFPLVFIVLMAILAAQNKLYWPVPTFDFIVLLLATFRLIRLFTYDMVTDFIRDYFAQFSGGPGRTIWNLLDCPWCTGIWMALVVFFLYFISPYAWYFLLVLALAGAGSFIQIVIWRIGRE